MAVKYEHPFQDIGTAFEKQSSHGLPPFETNYKIIAPSREGGVSSVNFNNGIALYNMHLKTGDTVKNLTVKTNEGPVFGFRCCLAGQKNCVCPGSKRRFQSLPITGKYSTSQMSIVTINFVPMTGFKSYI